MSTDANYIACWFIGGPWNNRLMEIHQGAVGRGIPIRAFFADVAHKIEYYYPSTPLETGVLVYSCLEDAIFGQPGHHFGLRSIHRRKP